MSRLPRRLRRQLLLRSFVIQGSWNYESLIGTGFAFVLLPVLRHIHRGDPQALGAAVERHTELFNSHPYLATLAAGAVARLELEGAEPQVVARFKGALRSSLGSLGDQLVWLSFRPALALLAIALLLLGAPWWAAVAGYLVLYNALHLWLRVWGLAVGLNEGLAVGSILRDAPLNTWARYGAQAGMTVAGAAAVFAVARAGVSAVELGIATAAAVGGAWLGLRVRQPAYFILLALWILGLGLGITSR